MLVCLRHCCNYIQSTAAGARTAKRDHLHLGIARSADGAPSLLLVGWAGPGVRAGQACRRLLFGCNLQQQRDVSFCRTSVKRPLPASLAAVVELLLACLNHPCEPWPLPAGEHRAACADAAHALQAARDLPHARHRLRRCACQHPLLHSSCFLCCCGAGASCCTCRACNMLASLASEWGEERHSPQTCSEGGPVCPPAGDTTNSCTTLTTQHRACAAAASAAGHCPCCCNAAQQHAHPHSPNAPRHAACSCCCTGAPPLTHCCCTRLPPPPPCRARAALHHSGDAEERDCAVQRVAAAHDA